MKIYEQIGMLTGWFGIPGAKSKWSTKVHIVEAHNRRPICGRRLSKRQKFQWCADGIVFDWVECSKCRESALELSKGRVVA